MFKLNQIGLSCLGGIVVSAITAPAVMAALSMAEINSIARQTTVLIAPALTAPLRQDLENNRNNPLNAQGVWNPGSGVIIAKEGRKYYVLTVAHNFLQRHLDTKDYWPDSKGLPYYGIRTGDGEIHVVTNVDDGRGCPLRGEPHLPGLVRFGCRDRFVPGTDRVDRANGRDDIKGIDIAIITFESDNDYPIAPLGDASQVNPGDTVYISGWPDPEKELDPTTGKCRGRVARRQRRLAWGPVTAKVNPDPQNWGYSIFYTDNTRAGMSGGPVFDRNGRVVGTHGMGSTSKPSCGGSPNTSSPAESGGDSSTAAATNLDLNTLRRQFSSSQNVNFFLELISRYHFGLPIQNQPPAREMIQACLLPIQEIASNTGQVEFDATNDAFEDAKDVVEDIYQLYSFKLENLLRDEASGGSGSLLLGDEDEPRNQPARSGCK
ncbi:MAG: hypothetical protein Fur0025_36310 [Oscillatoriaceae cyanobacterium]